MAYLVERQKIRKIILSFWRKNEKYVELRVWILFSNLEKYDIFKPVSKKEAQFMSEKERMSALELENRKLKTDNDMLLEIVAQMRVTLNRLILQYISADQEG